MKERPSAGKRAARVARMSAGVTGDYLGYLAQTLFLSPERRDEKLKKTHRTAAKRVSDGMMEMKGPLMKLGQALSLHEDLLPAETIQELSKLQMSAPGMHPSLVRAQFRASLNRYPEELLADFDETPFAAASLGQVHEARTKKGETVAVKIQYPGVREAIDGDFKWFSAAVLPARASKHLPDQLLNELKVQILAETDYGRERRNMTLFARELTDLAWLEVPTPIEKLSGDRVITMTRMGGMHFDAFLATKPSQRIRDLVGARLLYLYFRQVLQMGVLHGDPHWGNYLFHADGRIGLLDFGCVKHLDPAFVDNLRRVFLYPGDRSAPEFMQLMEERYNAAGSALTSAGKKALVRFSEDFYGKVYPAGVENDDVPFDFSDADFLRNYVAVSSALMRAKASLPEYVILARAEIGLYQALHRLRARVHTSRIVREIGRMPVRKA